MLHLDYSAQNTMTAPHSFTLKGKVLTRSYMSSHAPSPTRHLPNLIFYFSCLSLLYSTHTAFSPISQLCQVNKYLGPWHWLFPLPRMDSTRIPEELIFTSVKFLLKCHIFNEIYWDHLIWNYNQLSHPPGTATLLFNSSVFYFLSWDLEMEIKSYCIM